MILEELILQLRSIAAGLLLEDFPVEAGIIEEAIRRLEKSPFEI